MTEIIPAQRGWFCIVQKDAEQAVRNAIALGVDVRPDELFNMVPVILWQVNDAIIWPLVNGYAFPPDGKGYDMARMMVSPTGELILEGALAPLTWTQFVAGALAEANRMAGRESGIPAGVVVN